MNIQSAKRRREDNDGSAIAIDRLSQLPQPILQQILSLLSQKDAVRTCVLSKSWRYLWHGRLNVEFLDTHHRFIRNEEFWPFIDKTLQRYLDQNLSLQKFLVEIEYEVDVDIQYEVDVEILQKWIPIVITNMGVRSFNLIFHRSSNIVFPLQLAVFQSESLVELHLERCDLKILESTDNVMFNNLQTLRLHYVHITDEILEKIISSCPLIENLSVLHCIGLKSIKLHKHHNIKDFGCSVDKQTIIEIEDPHTLESFHFDNYCTYWLPPHKNMHFPHLKSLKLQRVKLPAETLVNFSSFFPCLNELTLTKCEGLKEFRLSSSSIKRLIIKTNLKNRIKAFIDTPNILYFECSGHDFLPSIKFTTTSNEWASHIFVYYMLKRSDKDATSWFLKLNNLLKALSQSHITLTLQLFQTKYQKVHINDSYGGFFKPVVVEHLNLSGCFSSFSHPAIVNCFDPAIVNCFLRICRPRYIHMDMYGDIQPKCNFAEYMSKFIPDEKGCYWLQDLEEVSTEVWNMKAKEWRCLKGTILHALCSEKQIRLRLTWKEQLSKFT
ncbi:hypothetical protein CASFOL_021903 [Castilleja foliolosa]|uniref:F-box domain-containing protein n=1 Tax=Castilleja foliolosa TaxID=1961234 RepID=A0ABD3D0M5_9LAMI